MTTKYTEDTKLNAACWLTDVHPTDAGTLTPRSRHQFRVVRVFRGHKLHHPKSPAQDGEQMPHLIFHFFGALDGLRDLVAQQATIALPEPMDCHGDRAFAHSQTSGDFRLPRLARFPHNQRLQMLEELAFAVGFQLPAQPGQDLFQHRQRPTPLEDSFGIKQVCWFETIPFLGCLRIERKQFLAAATFEPPGTILLIAKEAIETSE